MNKQRMSRIDHEIQRVVGTLISREIKDPRLGFTTVTRVETSPDLRNARIFVSIIGDRHAARQTMDALSHAAKFLRGELGHQIALRYVPELTFVEDRTTERAIAVSKAIREAQGGV
ncbi:MAG: 30S ribosome-binding factor RbfA [Candidatus Eremiobacteraeota bacterium]|nr:30S ribosome-binding factor RbfA [Candidatus Eremiobacteraeota bacterium]MBV9402834.1 30S ribosome-binding factor RbfA [Candidatus Eremiobacteraeota bacterium]